MFLVSTFLHDAPDTQAKRGSVDWLGIGLLTVGVGSLQYVLEEGNRDGWDTTPILFLMAIAAICLITFVVHELELGPNLKQ